MTGFLVIGGIGLAIVVVSLILGDIFEGIFDAFDLDFGAGIFSAPVVGSFLAAFGFGASVVMYAAPVGAAGGALSGLGSGLVVGGIALFMTRSLMQMPTDATPKSEDLVGTRGHVVTPIPDGGFGEVTVRLHGQSLKHNARSVAAVDAGERVEVVEVLSASSVLVRPVGAEPDGAGEEIPEQ